MSGQNRSEVATALADPTRQRDYSANFRVEANLGPVDLTSISTSWNFRLTAPINADGPCSLLFDGTLPYWVQPLSHYLHLISSSSLPFSFFLGFFFLFVLFNFFFSLFFFSFFLSPFPFSLFF